MLGNAILGKLPVMLCQDKITEEERKCIFDKFYTLNEHAKKLFIVSTTKRFNIERRRKLKTDTNSRRKQSFSYYFQIGNSLLQLLVRLQCKRLIPRTILQIFPKRRKLANILNTKFLMKPSNVVMEHIESFPKVESYYCRSNTQREYLDPSLSVKKMYMLYVEFCNDAYKKPKHIEEKEATRNEKRKDRESGEACLPFDLQNVLLCPKAEITNFFRKRKLNLYNLTTILLNNRNLNNFILWTDSCVPQNRNSPMSYAIAYFLKLNPSIQSITMKFSTPGHSCVQEIDAVHSSIERVLDKAEYFSPLSLLRILLKVNSVRPYKIIKMRKEYFKDYKSCTSTFDYKLIPFSKVKALRFTSTSLDVEYKEPYQSLNWKRFHSDHCKEPDRSWK
nr:unnamed protein product [Callosobruchus analis]